MRQSTQHLDFEALDVDLDGINWSDSRRL